MQLQATERETRQVMAELYKSCQADPVFFVEWALGHMTWSKQRAILRSVRDNEKTAVRACHGASKTFSAAEVAVWFLNCVPNSKVITTAPTYSQMKMLLWREINAIYARSRIQLEGECLMTEIKTAEDDHYAIGFSTDKPARAEGWHAPAILFIFDEAKGIPQWLWDAARGSMTGGFCRWLVISTTDGVQVGEQYHKIFTTENHGWNRLHVSAYDTPYVTGEKFRTIDMPDLARPDVFRRSEIPPAEATVQIATPRYIDDCRQEWGEDSVLFLTKVKGEIVDAGADSIIKLSQVERMVANAANPKFDATGAEEIGVDVARGGADDTVMYRRKGMRIVDHKVIASPQLPEKALGNYLAEEVERFAGQDKTIRIKIDDTGIGWGVTSPLEAHGFNVVRVNFGAAAAEPDKYSNLISEMWFEVGKIVHEAACAASDRLKAELVNRKSKPLDKKGRRGVESKDDYKARGFRSPDEADAFLLCFHEPHSSIGFSAGHREEDD